MKNFEIYNEGATEVKAVVSEENIDKYNVDVQDPFTVGLIIPTKKSEFSVTRSNGTVTAKFDVTIIFDENGHVAYFELKRDGGVISKGRNMLKSGKFVALCEKLGITVDVYFENFEDIKKGLL